MFEKLKKLFVVEDENATKASKAKSSSNTTSSTPNKKGKKESTFEPSAIIDESVTGKINPKFIDKLLKAIEKNNIKGFDYLEFKQTLQNLDKSMLEQTRYESAFAMAKTMGITVDQLKESASYYSDILKQEEKKFDDALRNQVEIQITQRKDDFKGLEDAIQQKQKQIELLQKEIEGNKAKLKASNKVLEGAKIKINRTKAEFDLSYQSVKKQIDEDLEKIIRYLK